MNVRFEAELVTTPRLFIVPDTVAVLFVKLSVFAPLPMVTIPAIFAVGANDEENAIVKVALFISSVLPEATSRSLPGPLVMVSVFVPAGCSETLVFAEIRS